MECCQSSTEIKENAYKHKSKHIIKNINNDLYENENGN